MTDAEHVVEDVAYHVGKYDLNVVLCDEIKDMISRLELREGDAKEPQVCSSKRRCSRCHKTKLGSE